MAAFLTRKALSRRALLLGAGATVALPWLDAMQSALAGPERLPIRSGFVFVPNGASMDDWTPKGAGWSKTLAPLKPLRRSVQVWTGLALDGARAHGDGPGDHARAAGSFLTCAHPRKTGGADLQVAVSIDQVIAQAHGDATPFASLELGLEPGRAGGVCDSGYSCAYSNNISWRTPSQPMAKETNPREVFARLFGDPDDAQSRAEREQRARERKSVLDAVLGDARRLGARLGPTDRRKLDEYFTAVRELEKRLARGESEEPAPEMPEGLLEGGGYPERLRIMYDLVALAWQTDRTRVTSLMVGNGGSNISYRSVGVPEGHHNLSHHGNDKAKLERIQKIDAFHIEQFRGFLERLDGIEERGKSLLHQSMIVYGSAIGDGNRHNHEDLPILFAGRGGGRVAAGSHKKEPRDTPLANLYLGMLRANGINAPSFGDSTKAAF